jgi:hypothetical protein
MPPARRVEETAVSKQPDANDGGARLARFLDALSQTPIPTAPPPHDGYSEALGLNLLALALRLEHVDRMAEQLTLADSTHMARSVSIDINITVLTPDQKRALRADPSNAQDIPDAVWLPVARQARTDLAPVVVRDAAGNVVPRTTQLETATALTHGMAKAFRMFLTADPRTEDRGELLHDIRYTLNRSRWLIEATIAAMIEDGRGHHAEHRRRVPGAKATDSTSIRDKAAEAITQLFPPDSPFLSLLDIAASEYLLVVEVPTDRAQSFLRYDAPVMPARSRGHNAAGAYARWAGFQQEFTVRYATVIPRAVNSYHVTLEVPPEMQVRRFFLTSDVDAPALRSLVNDMEAVARSYDDLRSVTPKLLELELQGIASRLAEFGRRRRRDLDAFLAYVAECYSLFRTRPPQYPARRDVDAPRAPEQTLRPGKPLVTRLAEFAQLYETDHFRKLADEAMTADELRRLATELRESELDRDIHVDNDPRENAGHAHWQRRPFGIDSQGVEPVRSTVYIALVDDPPSLASNVAKLLLAVLLLVLGFGLVLEPHFFAGVPLLSDLGTRFRPDLDATSGPMSSADAVVTMLLLVPGLMLSRLDIPSNKTVLGRLRLFPRYIAYTAVVIAGILAVAVAAGKADALDGPFAVAMIALLVLFGLVALDTLAKAVKRRNRVPLNRTSPQWLLSEVLFRPNRRKRRCTANFTTIESDDDA